MPQQRIAAKLGERLRRHGADFKPTDLTTFASGVPLSQGDPDIDALADRFVEACRIYSTEIARRNHAGRVLTVGVLVLASGVVGVVLAVLGMVVATSGPPPHPDPFTFLIGAAASLLITLGGMGATVYGAACMGWADTRLKMLLREAANQSNSHATITDI